MSMKSIMEKSNIFYNWS